MTQGFIKKLTSTGQAVQIVSGENTSFASTAADMPVTTIPQNTEGAEFTTLSITPSASANKLVIEFYVPETNITASTFGTIALFQDSTADALAVTSRFGLNANNDPSMTLRYIMTAGTTSSTTFKIRYGSNITNTMHMNAGSGGTQPFGIEQWNFTITEYSA